jgi:carbonic anhydrase
MPPNRRPFYRYYGSLTTPPCTEAAVWTIMKNVVSVPKDFVSDAVMLVAR